MDRLQRSVCHDSCAQVTHSHAMEFQSVTLNWVASKLGSNMVLLLVCLHCQVMHHAPSQLKAGHKACSGLLNEDTAHHAE